MDTRRFSLDKCPLLPVAVTFIIGILLSAVSFGLIVIAAAVAVSVWTCFARHFYLGILAASTAAGVLAGIAGKPVVPSEEFFGNNLVMSGIVEEMDEGDATRNMIVRIDSIEGRNVVPFNAFTVSWTFIPEIFPGDRIVFKSELTHLDMTTDVPLEFNYGRYLYDQGVSAATFIQEGRDVLSISQAEGVRYSLMRFRLKIVDYIASSALSPDTKTFLITTLTGDRSFLTPDDRDVFSRAGIAHVLALSGLHVAIISIIISWLLFPLTILRYNRLKSCVIVVFLWAFALMTGLTPSVVRAVIMASVFVAAGILERKPSPVNSLSFAAICILLFDPLAIYSIGFQLSFTAVIFILLFAEKLNPVNKRNRPLYIIVAWFATSFAAAMGTGIISAAYFNQFPIYFLIANIPFTLLLPFALGGGILFLLSGALGFHSHWLDLSLDFLCNLLGRIATGVASLPGAAVDRVYVSPAFIILFIAGMAAVAFMLHNPGRRSVAVAVTVTALTVIVTAFSSAIVEDDGIYFPRHKRYCVMMVPAAPELKVFTTAYPSDFSELEDMIKRKYSRFMTSRGIDRISISRVDNSIVKINDRAYMFTRTLPEPEEYEGTEIILTRGFKPELISPSGCLPERVLLSPCVNTKTAEKISARLLELNVQAVDLKHESVNSHFAFPRH